MDINEYRKRKAQNRQSSYIKFSDDGEVRYLRFLDANPSATARLKAYNSETKKYMYDSDIPDDFPKVSVVLKLRVAEYPVEGKPKIATWEFSEFLYNKFARAYVEDPDNGNIPDNVWKVKVANPGDLGVSYAFIRINATLQSHPIPAEKAEVVSTTEEAAEEEVVTPKAKKNKYFN